MTQILVKTLVSRLVLVRQKCTDTWDSENDADVFLK